MGAKITLGLLRLTDAAPLIVARELGIFAEEGLDVRLAIEPSWANVADKIAYSLMDGAVMLPPLAFALNLGLRGNVTPLVVPMSLSLKGNTITVSQTIDADISRGRAGQGTPTALDAARRFAAALRASGRAGSRPALAVVHAYSTHNLLLRYWLAAGGLDPNRDVELIVLPPAQVVDALASGTIVGFCAGAPWGIAAARAGIGRTLVMTSGIWNNHPEKVLAIGRRWAEDNPDQLQAMLRALLGAARYCDEPANARHVADLVAETLTLDTAAVLASLPGAAALDRTAADVSTFFSNAANFPWRSHAVWFLREMARWGYIGPDVEFSALAASVYRPDLYRLAADRVGAPVPTDDMKSEGEHGSDWILPAARNAIPMGPDCFCDGAVFDPWAAS
ncbi:MAG TPA: CmpA/NrtA family ABC transporter substrate-binding protein [Stellaceae bacterium]|nr:CmpA/NrtA family ABC transporter substrate-binding protein [Stellaceae bacterium]